MTIQLDILGDFVDGLGRYSRTDRGNCCRCRRLKPVVDFIQMNADEPLTPNELAWAGMG